MKKTTSSPNGGVSLIAFLLATLGAGCAMDASLHWTTLTLNTPLGSRIGLQPDGTYYSQVPSSTSVTVPSSGPSYYHVTAYVYGGGGGGGGATTYQNGGHGGNGGYVKAYMSVVPGETLNVSVGAGGNGGGGGGCTAMPVATVGNPSTVSNSNAPLWSLQSAGGALGAQGISGPMAFCGGAVDGTDGLPGADGDGSITSGTGIVEEHGGAMAAEGWGQGGAQGIAPGSGSGPAGVTGGTGYVILQFSP